MRLKRWEGPDHKELLGFGESFVVYSKFCGNIFIFILTFIAYYNSIYMYTYTWHESGKI